MTAEEGHYELLSDGVEEANRGYHGDEGRGRRTRKDTRTMYMRLVPHTASTTEPSNHILLPVLFDLRYSSCWASRRARPSAASSVAACGKGESRLTASAIWSSVHCRQFYSVSRPGAVLGRLDVSAGHLGKVSGGNAEMSRGNGELAD